MKILHLTLAGLSVLAISTTDLFASSYGSEARSRLEKLLEIDSQDLVTKLDQMDQMKLKKAESTHRPWSGWSWPDHLGLIANPYGKRPSSILEASPILRYMNSHRLFWEPSRELLTKWIDQYTKVGYENLSKKQIMYLSPAEKYDLLLGHTDLPMTRKIMERLTLAYENDLTAEWTGICHGWSPASLVYDRPAHSFEVVGATGQVITFFPDDIKALTSYLWGQQPAWYQMEGWRCGDEGEAEGTDRFARIKNAQCNDVDPAAFHIIMTNRIGIAKKGMIMDIKYDGAVFNQPTFKYEYGYFHPVTGRFEKKLKDATAAAQDAGLPYKKFRAPETSHVVGIWMDVTYVAEVPAQAIRHDSSKRDEHAILRMQYDLELDRDGNIIGGEWRPFRNALKPEPLQNRGYAHPDFIWFPGKNLDIKTQYDEGLTPIQSTAEFKGRLVELSARAREATTFTNCDFKNRCGYPAPLPLKTLVEWLHRQSL